MRVLPNNARPTIGPTFAGGAGLRALYRHCKEKHLHRYLAEFDFRYNNRVKLGVDDKARTAKSLHGIVDKRLTYRDSSAGRARGSVWRGQT
jgi:hypothetical protein